MPVKYALTDIPYTRQDVLLGSLVPSISKPHQDTAPPPHRLREGVDFRWRNQKNFTFVLRSDKKAFFRAQLTRLFSASGVSSSDQDNQLWSKEGRIYELSQPRMLFKQLVKRQSTRDWLMDTVDNGDDVHFVVGYRTFFDARQNDSINTERAASAKVHLPADMIASGGASAATGNLLDSEVGGGGSTKSLAQESFEIPGERVFAICFRKVRFNWLRRTDVDSVRLDNDNCWVITSIRQNEGEAAVIAVEVDLEDQDEGGSMGGGSTLVETGEGLEEYYPPFR